MSRNRGSWNSEMTLRSAARLREMLLEAARQRRKVTVEQAREILAEEGLEPTVLGEPYQTWGAVVSSAGAVSVPKVGDGGEDCFFAIHVGDEVPEHMKEFVEAAQRILLHAGVDGIPRRLFMDKLMETTPAAIWKLIADRDPSVSEWYLWTRVRKLWGYKDDIRYVFAAYYGLSVRRVVELREAGSTRVRPQKAKPSKEPAAENSPAVENAKGGVTSALVPDLEGMTRQELALAGPRTIIIGVKGGPSMEIPNVKEVIVFYKT